MSSSQDFKLEFGPEQESTFGPCNCCGEMTRRVWGFVYKDEIAFAAYFVEWTPTHEDRAANFDFIYGKWGDDTLTAERYSISFAFRHLNTGPSFMAIDSSARLVSANSLVGSVLSREQTLTEPFRYIAFALCDVVYLNDPRIDPLR